MANRGWLPISTDDMPRTAWPHVWLGRERPPWAAEAANEGGRSRPSLGILNRSGAATCAASGERRGSVFRVFWPTFRASGVRPADDGGDR